MSDVTDLSILLHQTFGFRSFRANQEAVCQAAVEGQDVLLVMPTGAGKSLCYQLPTIARGGTALVISPLIALMDDQAGKLAAAGLSVARIHSGLDREQSRQACRDYLDGKLQFLFIAPERMRVPGFPEMLAKRKPALVAIDEAHCISAWGHDFRPDYRTLGQYLPMLRPAPIMALTATATPTVQRDIVTQLQLQSPSLFIHGFRRDNLAIEVVEMSKPRRAEFITKLLSDKERRPAIVYAPSRRTAEELAEALGRKFPAAAYHAGFEPAVRERVQREFLTGKLDVVVATVAFGMGIDKADVRMVVHAAMPASVEGYYQEIGRAGRDGLPSRAVLLHSFVDRRIHDGFVDRDYPEVRELDRVAALLTDEFQDPEPIRARLRMDAEIFGRAIEKLTAQGGAVMDFSGGIRRSGSNDWRAGYAQQVDFRRRQIESMVQFAQGSQCRMSMLVQHFGDRADTKRSCGLCDVCAPQGAQAQSFRAPESDEERLLGLMLRELDSKPRSTGKLFTDCGGKDRRVFDNLLDALVRHGWVSIAQDTFVNQEGSSITYRKATLTYEGRERGHAGYGDLMVSDSGGDSGSGTAKKSRKSEGAKKATQAAAEFTGPQAELDKSLRAWRKAKATGLGVPAFLVLTDSALTQVVLARPQNVSSLLSVNGIGQDKADRFGAEILALCRGESLTAPDVTASASPKVDAKPKVPAPQRAERPVSHAPKQDTAQAFTRPERSHAGKELTAGQQQLDRQLRDWRNAESERTGMPPFFVLGSSALRSLVMTRPTTMEHLRSLEGLTPERRELIGPALLEICRGASS